MKQKDNKKIQKEITLWTYAGRVLPFVALFVLIIAITFDLDDSIKLITTAVASVFAAFAFYWWWWVIDIVRNLFDMLEKTQKKFESVLKEIRNLKRDIK